MKPDPTPDQELVLRAGVNAKRAPKLWLWWVDLISWQRDWIVDDGWMFKIVWLWGVPYLFTVISPTGESA